jgi:sugar diacid utilization regulator
VLRGAAGELDAVDLQRAVDDLPGRHAVAARGALLVTVTQAGLDRGAVLDACRDAFPGASLAVGAERRGLGGARDSLTDAELTLAVIEVGATGTFEEAWLWATLQGAATRLGPLLAPGSEVAVAHPHLAEAVEAFAGAGFSVSEAARRLSLHANTVSYRLDRWTELTGWDPRRFPGLVRSVAALRLRERPASGAGS